MPTEIRALNKNSAMPMDTIPFNTRTVGTYLRWLCMLCIALAIVAYALFQARFLLTGPALALEIEPVPVQSTPTIAISGTAKNITSLTLNGRTIYTTEAGVFEELVILEKGYTIVTLE